MNIGEPWEIKHEKYLKEKKVNIEDNMHGCSLKNIDEIFVNVGEN